LSPRSLRLIGQGREAEVFEWPDGRVLKLLRAAGPSTGLAFEIAALDAARSAGVSVPQVYEEVVIEEIVNLAVRALDEIPGERPRLLQRLRQECARGDAS